MTGRESSISQSDLQPPSPSLPGEETPQPVSRLRSMWAWGAGAAACLLLGKAAIDAAPFGPLAEHMAEHLLLMNAVAPLLAFAAVAAVRNPHLLGAGRSLAIATAVQLSLLWAWHAPPALSVASQAEGVHMLMRLSLAASALWFWVAVVSDRSAFRWRALFALLVTGKLFCLLGVLLVFAPRLLYGGPDHGHSRHHLAEAVDALADQHLGGLMMLVVCPLTYVLAGVVIAAQWLRDLTHAGVAPGRVISDDPDTVTIGRDA